jgi:DNA-directed RNA polymerase specialized sigma24 family protein
MASSEDDPPESGDLPASDEREGPGEEPSSGAEGSANAARAISSQPVPVDVVRAFLARPTTGEQIRALAARRAPAEVVEDIIHDTFEEALQAAVKAPPRDAVTLPAWIRTIARRVIADFHAKRERREEYEAPMPSEPVESWSPDEGSPHVPVQAWSPDEGPPPALAPTFDPRDAQGAWPNSEDRVVRWVERNVERNPRDRETFEILLERAREGKTYGQIAEERGMTLTALSSRIFEFKGKYLPRYKRERDRSILLLLLWGTGLVVALVGLWLFLHRAPVTPPIMPVGPPPAPSVTATAAPFDPAVSPPQPPRDEKPKR